jgi:hypothetical protein
MSTASTSGRQASSDDMGRLQQLLNGVRVTQLLSVAAKLGVADLLAGGTLPIDQLALMTGANADALYRVLRTLASIGVFEETAERRFALTPIAMLLQENHPFSARAQAIWFGGESYRAWGDLLHTVMTGETAFDHVFGAQHFDYLARHPEASEFFNRAMTASSQRAIADIVAAYDFSSARTVADIGGGHGRLISAMLQANPALHGILFDAAHVVAGALPLLEATGVVDRCERTGGDFFTSVPSGADVYMMRHIIHDWDDERSIMILRTCAQAMAPSDKVLVIDAVIQPGNEPSPAKFLDVTMMVMNGGRERTEDEFRRLFAAAGLAVTRILPAGAESIIEGARA